MGSPIISTYMYGNLGAIPGISPSWPNIKVRRMSKLVVPAAPHFVAETKKTAVALLQSRVLLID